MESLGFTDGGFLLNWIRILIFSPILSGLLVYAIMSLDASGGSIIDTLPIVPREQAKSKLFLIFIFQTCATLLPSLMYLTNPNFNAIIANFLFTLPFNWLILLIIFLLRIELFGKKKKKYYVLGNYNPKNRLNKWTMIISVPFGLLIWVFSIFLQFYYSQDLDSMITFFWIFLIVGFLIVFIFYDTLLPSYKKESFLFVKKVELKPTYFSRNTKLSIISLVIIDYVSLFIFFFSISFIWTWIDPYDYYSMRQQDFSYLFKIIVIFGVPCILLLFIWFYFVPKCLGLPNGRQSLSQYLDYSGLSWLKLILNKKNLKTIVFVISSISVLYIVTSIAKLQDSSNLFNIDINIILWASYLILFFFQELLYRGIILTILMKKSGPKKAIVQQAIIFLISKSFIPYLLIITSSQQIIDVDQLLYYLVFEFIYIFVSGLLLGITFYKRRSLLPGLVSLSIISLFYPLPFLFFTPIMLYQIG